MANLDDVFQAFTKLAGAKNPVEETRMNSKTCEKMVKECLPKGVVKIADACIFPIYKERNKPYFLINNFRHFIHGCAYEYAKKKSKNPRLHEGDPQVDKYYQEFTHGLLNGKPIVKEIKVSKTDDTKTSNVHFIKQRKVISHHKDMSEHTGHVKGSKEEKTHVKKF